MALQSWAGGRLKTCLEVQKDLDTRRVREKMILARAILDKRMVGLESKITYDACSLECLAPAERHHAIITKVELGEPDFLDSEKALITQMGKRLFSDTLTTLRTPFRKRRRIRLTIRWIEGGEFEGPGGGQDRGKR